MQNLKQLIKEFRELRENAPFVPKENWSFKDSSHIIDCPECTEEIDVSGFSIQSSDEHQCVDIQLYGLESICEAQAKYITHSANNITKLLDAVEVLVEELEFLSTDEAYQREESDHETGYFDSYKGPQDSAQSALKLAEEKVRK